MIEEIKKEIKVLPQYSEYMQNINGSHWNIDTVSLKSILEILDKYNNQDNATNIIEDIISTIRDFKENDIEAICKVLLNKYRNICGNCLKCDYFTLAKFKNAWEELKKYQIDLDKTNMDTLVRDNSEFYHYQRGNMMGHKNIGLKIQELEKKHGIKENKDAKDKRY